SAPIVSSSSRMAWSRQKASWNNCWRPRQKCGSSGRGARRQPLEIRDWGLTTAFCHITILPRYIDKRESVMSPLEEGTLPPQGGSLAIERTQTGVRMEKRMVKVLKALAEYFDISLGDLIEGIVLHAFASQAPFSAATIERIAQLKQVYGMDYGVEAS